MCASLTFGSNCLATKLVVTRVVVSAGRTMEVSTTEDGGDNELPAPQSPMLQCCDWLHLLQCVCVCAHFLVGDYGETAPH